MYPYPVPVFSHTVDYPFHFISFGHFSRSRFRVLPPSQSHPPRTHPHVRLRAARACRSRLEACARARAIRARTRPGASCKAWLMAGERASRAFALQPDASPALYSARLQLEQLTGSAENAKGVTLALCSSLFIGASFIIKKKGTQVPAGGTRCRRTGVTSPDHGRH